MPTNRMRWAVPVVTALIAGGATVLGLYVSAVESRLHSIELRMLQRAQYEKVLEHIEADHDNDTRRIERLELLVDKVCKEK